MAEDISEAEDMRRKAFARLVSRGYVAERPPPTDLYSSGSRLPMVSLPLDTRLPLRSGAPSVGLEGVVRVSLKNGPRQ